MQLAAASVAAGQSAGPGRGARRAQAAHHRGWISLLPSAILACETRLAAAIRERTALLARPASRQGGGRRNRGQQQPKTERRATGCGGGCPGPPAGRDQRRSGHRPRPPSRSRWPAAGAHGLPARDLALAAPTGKAANRLQESFQAGLGALPAPSPEDRALQSACRQPRPCTACWATRPQPALLHHQNHRLAAQAVIVDEGFDDRSVAQERLLRALRDDAVLLLLGDAISCLPSTQAPCFATWELWLCDWTEAFARNQAQSAGRRISECAQPCARAMPANWRLCSRAATSAALAFDGVELVPGTEREAVLQRWYQDRIAALPSGTSSSNTNTSSGRGIRALDDARLNRLHAHWRASACCA